MHVYLAQYSIFLVSHILLLFHSSKGSRNNSGKYEKLGAITNAYFLMELNNIFQVYLKILTKLWLTFCYHQQRIQKMSQFWHFHDYNSGSEHNHLTNDPIFIYFLSATRLNISFLYFKIFKIQFHRVPFTFSGL